MFHQPGKDDPDKYAPRSELGVILGQSPSSRGAVRAYIINTSRIRVRHLYTIIKSTPVDLLFTPRRLDVPSSIPSFIDVQGRYPSLKREPDEAVDGNQLRTNHLPKQQKQL